MSECAVCLSEFTRSKWHPRQETCSPKCSSKLEYIRHKSAYVQRATAWRIANPDLWKAHAANTRSRKPELYRAISRAKQQRRVAKMASCKGSFTAQEWLDLVIAQRGRCWWCYDVKPLQADHVIPISKGGTNDMSNIVASCGPCNSRKRDNVWDTRDGALYQLTGGIFSC